MNSPHKKNSQPFQTLAFGYRVSRHERDIIKFFKRRGGTFNLGNPNLSPVGDRQLFICFTNRSGSNYLGAVLKSTGQIPQPREFFTSNFVTKFSSKNGLDHFHSYCRELGAQFSINGLFASKVSMPQLFFLERIGAFRTLFPNPVFVHIKRRDFLGQAISYSIANQTKVWTSAQERSSREPTFDAGDIKKYLGSILRDQMRCSEFFALSGQPCLEVIYEELVAAPQEVLAPVFAGLGIESAFVDLETIELRKQRNAINDQFRTRFLEECRCTMIPTRNVLSEFVYEKSILESFL